MCGLVAVIASRGELPPRDTLVLMRDMLAHRGPDEATLEIIDDRVALGHRRLSIIDIEGSPQPLRSVDGQTVCIFNGEIYNFVELRSRLTALGQVFRTAGDGEVIVQGYERWGDEIFAKLEGMFAVVLFDRRRNRVIVARDRFGIKPLFYTERPGQVVVGSEIKAILASAPGTKRASAMALALGSIRMHVPWPYTAFEGIYRVPPGAALIIDDHNRTRLERFAPLSGFRTVQPSNPEDASAIIEAAVRRQMVADVPVGAFLSGGIDSSLTVAMMRQVSNAEIHTFSLRTSVGDESTDAAESAAKLGVTHHTIEMNEIEFDDLAELARLYDEPFAETSALGVRALSRVAREHVKVALSGDGGDEVFGGYGSYRSIHFGQLWRVPGRTAIASLAHRALHQRAYSPLIRRALRAALLVGDTPAEAQRDMTTLNWCAGADQRARSEALSRDIAGCASIPLGDEAPLRLAMYADRFERLSNAMLSKVDIASMSASLEVRVPMLDDQVVAYADGLATKALISPRWGKVVLRRVLAKTGVGHLAWRTKRGFSLPLDRWLRIPRVRDRMGQLFGDHRQTLKDLTSEDVSSLWRAFLDGKSRFSDGTAAMQLLWYASVAQWSDLQHVTVAAADHRAPPVV